MSVRHVCASEKGCVYECMCMCMSVCACLSSCRYLMRALGGGRGDGHFLHRGLVLLVRRRRADDKHLLVFEKGRDVSRVIWMWMCADTSGGWVGAKGGGR